MEDGDGIDAMMYQHGDGDGDGDGASVATSMLTHHGIYLVFLHPPSQAMCNFSIGKTNILWLVFFVRIDISIGANNIELVYIKLVYDINWKEKSWNQILYMRGLRPWIIDQHCGVYCCVYCKLKQTPSSFGCLNISTSTLGCAQELQSIMEEFWARKTLLHVTIINANKNALSETTINTNKNSISN